MRKLLTALLVVAACGGDDANNARDGGVDTNVDPPQITPMLTSFVATPSQLQAGVPTSVTWSWTYANEPTVPDPSCTIDNGVGPITRDTATTVTLNAVTTFTLTCTNTAGSAMRQVVIGVPPVAPVIGSFSISPTAMPYNTPTNLTFTWTYTNTPTPAPVCTVDGVATPLVSGQPVSVTLPQARTFRLKCTNAAGTSYTGSTVADVLVGVNECGTAAAECNANATCTDTPNSYVCTCNNGYTGDGDTCSVAMSNTCDPNATAVGMGCICKAGYIGDGNTCTKLHYAFTTSTTGSGNLLTGWGVTAANGLAAADAVCAARATAAGLTGTYRAWMSDSQNDAYCRIHNLSGKKANNCGLGALPVAAGPWVRTGDYKAFAPAIDKLLAPNHQVFYAADYNESGVQISSTTDRVWTGTDDNGVYSTGGCSDWTSSSSGLSGTAGEVLGGGTSWTKSGTADLTCSNFAHLRCMEVQTGPALPPRHPTSVKRAFITSVAGTGQFSSWPDSNGVSGSTAADAICQSRARYAGYINPQNFKAWFTYYPNSISGRIFNSGTAYARPDGVVLASTKTDLLDLRFAAPWSQTELNTYLTGNADTGSVWTGVGYQSTSGSYYSSSSSYNCIGWTYPSTYSAPTGRYDMLDYRAMFTGTLGTCDQMNRLYCVED